MTRNLTARLAGAVVLAVAASIPAGSSRAASTICSEIAARLASLGTESASRSGGNDRAIAVQQRELRRADEEIRRLGCGFSVSGTAIERCASLARQIDAMEANFAELHRDAGNVPEPYSLERARLIRLSNAKGCDRQPAPESGVVRILRPGTADDPTPASPAGDPNHIVLQPQQKYIDPNGSYRTMCVRTCDGYYFPISYGVAPVQFAADEAACRRRCPGTEARLYFQQVPGDDSERMISVADGTPYTALPHAFLYREPGRERTAGCTCRVSAAGLSGAGAISQRGYEVLSPNGDAKPIVDGSIVRIPAPAPEVPAAIAAPPAPGPAKPEQQAKAHSAEETTRAMPTDQNVRVVGPRFFPAPSEAEVLRVPGPTPGR